MGKRLPFPGNRGQPGHEFSLEANPDSLTADKIAILADHGVNRLSLGVQSFQPGLLGVLERTHRPEHVAPALERARQRIAQVSLDLSSVDPQASITSTYSDYGTPVSVSAPAASDTVEAPDAVYRIFNGG